MKDYQTIVGFLIMSAAIICAAFIVRNNNGRYTAVQAGQSAVFVIDTQTGDVKLDMPR